MHDTDYTLDSLTDIRLLYVEDEPDLSRETVKFLKMVCGGVEAAMNGAEALKLFDPEHHDVVLTDIRMPVMDGVEFARRLKQLSPSTPLVFCTAFAEPAYMLQAIEIGAAGFVNKPIRTDDLLPTLLRAALPVLQKREISALSRRLSESVEAQLGSSPALQDALTGVRQAIRSSYHILILGETGTGKSRLAGLIHSLSPRHGQPFVPINLSAVQETLIESELFGHVRGAFTGAAQAHEGLIQKAAGGTLFLDDIDAVSLGTQSKLLRFADERSFYPVGSGAQVEADVRLITASNRNLAALSTSGSFRSDLYFRLAEIVINLPPLRDMTEEIPRMSRLFLHESCDELGREYPVMTEPALKLLGGYAWPGNIRQLKNVMRRLALAVKQEISGDAVAACLAGAPLLAVAGPPNAGGPPFPATLQEIEKWAITEALTRSGGGRMAAARLLGLNYYTFKRKLEKLGITEE